MVQKHHHDNCLPLVVILMSLIFVLSDYFYGLNHDQAAVNRRWMMDGWMDDDQFDVAPTHLCQPNSTE